MYSRKAWGGPVEPFILIKFMKPVDPPPENPIVSLVIFEWADEDLIGVYPTPESPTVCSVPLLLFATEDLQFIFIFIERVYL
jgi:hypothetical protein